MKLHAHLPLLLVASVGCADLVGIEERSFKDADQTPLTSSSSGTFAAGTSSAGGNLASGGGGGDAQGTGGSAGNGGAPGTGGDEAGGGGAAPCSDDLTSDTLHCGACGHDCLGGECEDSVCQPVRISAPLAIVDEYRSLVVDEDRDGEIFFARWRLDGVVYRVAKEPDATPFPVHILEQGGWANDIQIDHDWIYFTNFSDTFVDDSRGIYAKRRTGGTPVQLLRGGMETLGTAYLRVDGDEIFFTTYFGSTELGRVKFDGGPALPLSDLGDAPPYYVGGALLAIDDEWVYSGSTNRGVWRYRRDGSESQLIEGRDVPAVVAGVEDGWVYWTQDQEDEEGDENELRRAPVDGSEVSVSIGDDVGAPIFHRGYLYSVRGGGTEVRRVSLDDPSGPDELLATTPFGIGSLAVDEASVFWMDYGTAEIYRLALPTATHRTTPPGWDCLDDWYDDGGSCDCGCGAPDPDCEDDDLFIYGCGTPHGYGRGVACSATGACVIPGGWTCADLQYADGEVCNCQCGAPDPDCEVGRLHVTGCGGAGWYCHEDACILIAATSTCDDAHMGAGDGCDCGCNAYDLDCDDSAQAIHGCGPTHAAGNGPACLADSGCEAPAAWTGPASAYQDYATCDCERGAVDPDCLVDLDLPVPACDVGQRCPADECVDIAAGDVCATAELLLPGTIDGDFATVIDDYDVGDLGPCELFGSTGRDLAYRVELDAGQSVEIVVDPSDRVDTSIYLVTSCDDVHDECVAGIDDGWLDEPETLTYTATEAVTLFLVVDQYASPDGPTDGTFTLSATFTP